MLISFGKWIANYGKEAGLNVAGMDVAVTSVQFNGKQADAAVSISAKGSRAAQGMPMKYRLEQRDSKWVVIAREDWKTVLELKRGNPYVIIGDGSSFTPKGETSASFSLKSKRR